MEYLIIILAIIVGVLLLRVIGAWLLRINEIIRNQDKTLVYQDDILKELRKMNKS